MSWPLPPRVWLRRRRPPSRHASIVASRQDGANGFGVPRVPDAGADSVPSDTVKNNFPACLSCSILATEKA